MKLKANKESLCLSPAIFNYFKSLTDSNEEHRKSSSLKLIDHIFKAQDEKREKEVHYTLRRLVRGVGASTTSSRAGFFTTLVGLLNAVPNDISTTNVLEITKKELQVGGVIVNKEDADAIVGQILVCGALLRSRKISSVSTSAEVEEVIKILIASTKHRSYHSALAYSFITYLLRTISEEQFTESVWPLLESEITQAWSKQTINSINCIFVGKHLFPNILTTKYLKSKLGSSQILYPDNYKQIIRIFWDHNNPNIILHEAFSCLGLIFAESKYLVDFWSTEVAKYLQTPNKLKEIQTLKIITDIIDNIKTDTVNISELLNKSFIKMIVSSLQSSKTKKDETLRAFYDDFFESLRKKFTEITDEHEKVQIIKKMILHPGTLSLEKYTSSRIIHQFIFQLKEEGIKEIFEVYKEIFLNKAYKNPEDKSQVWLNFERQNAGYILQTLLLNKNVQNARNWRLEELKFFMNYGLFFISEEGEIVRKEAAGKISQEFGEQMKSMFFSCLQAKQPSLKDERKLLYGLSTELNIILSQDNIHKKVRGKFDESVMKIWEKVFQSMSKKTKKVDETQLVFEIVLLHMGLQLFRDAKMAENAILDLEKCMDRIKAKHLSGDEPEWIEVVTDLFLHLMSQNNACLKHVVNSVFPHLCKQLSFSAVHQILSVLDMNNFNPLNSEIDEETEYVEEEGSEYDEEEESDNEGEIENENEQSENDDDDEDSNVTDKLRNAVSIALGASIKDDDQESIDLNDLTEEEGKKLDNALSAAFQAMKKTSTSSNKKSKSHRIQTTTIMHFRIRVLDLVEIYIQNNPSQLATVEIMLTLFNMVEFCTGIDMKPLQIKIEKVLQKLTAIKQFENDGDIDEDSICNFIRLIVEKKVTASIFDFHNKLKSKCCLFLINCSKNISTSEKIVDLLCEYIDDFITSRNPNINITVLNEIFKLKWEGVKALVQRLAVNGLEKTVRTFRRIQVLEILSIFFKNFNEMNLEFLSSVCKHIINYINQMAKKDPHEISAKEFNLILHVAYVAHKKFKCLGNIIDTIQEIRKTLKLDSTNDYNQICKLYNVTAIKNFEISKPVVDSLSDPIPKAVCSNNELEKSKENGITRKRKNSSKKITKGKET